MNHCHLCSRAFRENVIPFAGDKTVCNDCAAQCVLAVRYAVEADNATLVYSNGVLLVDNNNDRPLEESLLFI